MQILITIVVFVLVISLLVLVHELGHFWAAKIAGVKVEEFGFGLPPRLWGFKPKKSEVIYSINAIPFGGFVRLFGEELVENKIKKGARSFAAKGIGWKVLIVVAGVVMNFLFAWLMLIVGYNVGMKPIYLNEGDFLSGVKSGEIVLQEGAMEGKTQQSFLRPVMAEVPAWLAAYGVRPGAEIIQINGQQLLSEQQFGLALQNQGQAVWRVKDSGSNYRDVQVTIPRLAGLVVTGVEQNSLASSSDLRVGDRILTVNGQDIVGVEDYFNAKSTQKEQIKLTISRENNVFDKTIQLDQSGLLGVYLGQITGDNWQGLQYYFKPVSYSLVQINPQQLAWWQIPGKAAGDLWGLGVYSLSSLVDVFSSLFTRFQVPEGVMGPVGIAQMTYVYLQEGLSTMIQFVALLSLSLGIINILPFPGLDGGRLALILIPKIFNRTLDAKLEAYINMIGFLLLILLILLVTFNDLARLITG